MVEHMTFMLVSMITFAVLLRRFGLETVGLWTLFTALLNYSRIGDVWSKGLLSFIGEERGRGAMSDAAAYASTTITTGAAGYLFVMSAGGTALYFLAPQIVPPEHISMVRQNLPLMVAAYWLIACSGNFLLAFVGFGLPWLRSVQRIGGALLLLLGVVMLDPETGLRGIVSIQLLQGAVMLVFGAAVFYGHVTRDVPHKIWDRRKFDNLFRFGGKLFFVGSIQFAIEPMIKLLVSQFAGLAVLATLEVVMRLIQGVRGLILSLGQVVVTSFAKRRGRAVDSRTSLLRDDFAIVSRLILGVSVVTFSLLFAAGPLISFLFLDAEARTEVGDLFPSILLVFGFAWFINTAVSSGQFLLMSLRKTRGLFFSVAIRAGLIAILGFPLGTAFGLVGVMAAVLLAFLTSSVYLFTTATEAVGMPLSQGLIEFFRSGPGIFIPLVWALGLTILNALVPGAESAMPMTSATGLFIAGLLLMKFGRVRLLAHTVMTLRS